MSHKSDAGLFGPASPAPQQAEFVESLLSGSQRKTAFALRMNSEKLIRLCGLDSCGFLTLTVGDYNCKLHGHQIPEEQNYCPQCYAKKFFRRMNFVGVTDATEASRRVNSVRGYLLTIFKLAIIVTERHKTGNIHFHLLAGLASGKDIRTGLDFDKVYRRDYRSASPDLRDLWRQLRRKLPHYGFGRHELLPIRKTGEAVSAYISKYIEKNVCNRTPADKRKKLVRYFGWSKEQLKPNEFEWNGAKAKAWRAKTAQLFALAGCELRDAEVTPTKRVIEDCVSAAGKIRPKCLDGSEIKKKFGARWAFTGTGIWSEVEGDNILPFLDLDGRQTLKAQELLAEAQGKFEKKILENFRWMKGLIYEQILNQDEMTGKYDFWQMEFERDGLQLEKEYFDYLENSSKN